MILLFLSVRVGVDAAYHEGQTTLFIRVSRFTVCIYPRKKKSAPKQKKETDKTKAKKRSNLTKDEVLDGIEVAVRAVRKLRFHLYKLKLHFISAFDDPYRTAMVYGYVNAAVQAFALPQLRQSDIQLGVDFEREHYYIDGYVSVTIRVYYIIKLICCVACGAVPLLWRIRKRLKETKSSGAVKGKVA